MLRGVYFASGTQEGTPIDRLTGTLVRTFGLDQRRAAALRPEQGRSYFLGTLDLPGDPGRGHAGERTARRPGAARRAARRLVCRHGFGDPGRGGLAGRRSLGRPSARSTGCRRHWPPTRRSPRQPRSTRSNNSDLPRLLPLLDAARNLQTGRGQPARRHPVELRLLAGRQAAHRRRYGLSACPGLCVAAAPDLAAGSPDARQLHPARLPVRGDARLSDARRPGPARPGPGQGMDDLRLAGRVCRRRTMWRCWPDLRAISMRSWRSPCRRCRSTMRWWRRRARPSAAFRWQRASTRASSPSAAAQACRRGGRATRWDAPGVRLFIRASGKKLSDGVPGFLTVDGFHKVLLPALPAATREVASESWVMGQKVPANLDRRRSKPSSRQQRDHALRSPTTPRRGTA